MGHRPERLIPVRSTDSLDHFIQSLHADVKDVNRHSEQKQRNQRQHQDELADGLLEKSLDPPRRFNSPDERAEREQENRKHNLIYKNQQYSRTPTLMSRGQTTV